MSTTRSQSTSRSQQTGSAGAAGEGEEREAATCTTTTGQRTTARRASLSGSRRQLGMGPGWYDPPWVSVTEQFSAHHPMVPKRYVPQWQLDMKNRRLIIQNCMMADIPTWTGHISYFWEGRERLNATRHQFHDSIVSYSRCLHRNSSAMSKYNSTLLAMGRGSDDVYY